MTRSVIYTRVFDTEKALNINFVKFMKSTLNSSFLK